MRGLCAALVICSAVAAPLSAQSLEPPVSLRGFALVTEQEFAAATTFNGIFGSASGQFLGGGAQVVLRSGPFVELGASRFARTGERAFLFNGDVSRLGIPLTVTIKPVEVTGGYRLRLRRYPGIVPYLGAGFGSYGYRETSSSDSSENLDTKHTGTLAVGGVEIKVHRWITLSADAQYTHIPGILGTGGISKDANERDLGGVAARFKLIVGR